jgi:hypothetical protein
MGTTAAMNPHTAWAARKAEQAGTALSVRMQACIDVERRVYISFDNVSLIEYGEPTDLGVLRLEPQRIVFAGHRTTRMIPFGSVVLLGTQDVLGSPGLTACCVNSTEHLGTMTFVADIPLEYHVGAWYSRWLESAPFTEVEPSDTLSLPPAHR